MKTVTSNTRNNSQVAILHLFDFDMYNLDGTFKETLRFTDHDIFVQATEDNLYTPLAITFDRLQEDGSMQSDSISINIDNISGALTAEALASEWRNNPATITRVIYTPSADHIDGQTYEYGYGDMLDDYPKIRLYQDIGTEIPRTIPFTIESDAQVASVDSYVMFKGIIDTFSATEQALSGTITSLFTNWSKAFPERTFNQTEFTDIVDAMTETVYWGRTP